MRPEIQKILESINETDWKLKPANGVNEYYTYLTHKSGKIRLSICGNCVNISFRAKTKWYNFWGNPISLEYDEEDIVSEYIDKQEKNEIQKKINKLAQIWEEVR